MYGFHNVTAENGTKEALAADVIDDNNPTSLNLPFILHLLAAAENNGLTTGVYWNLSAEKVAAIHAAVAAKNWKATACARAFMKPGAQRKHKWTTIAAGAAS